MDILFISSGVLRRTGSANEGEAAGEGRRRWGEKNPKKMESWNLKVESCWKEKMHTATC